MNVFEMIDQDDCFTLACLIAIHERRTNMANPNVRQWGKRAGGRLCPILSLRQLYAEPCRCPRLPPYRLSRAIAAGLAMGVTWIILAIGIFAFQYLRTAAKTSWLSDATAARRQSEADTGSPARKPAVNRRKTWNGNDATTSHGPTLLAATMTPVCGAHALRSPQHGLGRAISPRTIAGVFQSIHVR